MENENEVSALDAVSFANSLIEFVLDCMKEDTPLLKHYGVINIQTKESNEIVSLWGCKIDSENETRNPMQRIEQLVAENQQLKERIAQLEKGGKHGN